MAEVASTRLRQIPKPPPLDLSTLTQGGALTPSRIQLWSALRVAPEALSPSSPLSCDNVVTNPTTSVSPVASAPAGGGWASLPAHLLELIFAALRDSQGRWPSRKVLFGVCGVCKLWRRVGHTLFFSNVWVNHSEVIVHPSQLFTLCPYPLRLLSSEHLLRCFVQRSPCPAAGLSPRFSRLWQFEMYLGADHRGLQRAGGGGGGDGAGGDVGGWGLGASGGSSGSPTRPRGSTPQLLLCARQTSRRSYQLLLRPLSCPAGPDGALSVTPAGASTEGTGCGSPPFGTFSPRGGGDGSSTPSLGGGGRCSGGGRGSGRRSGVVAVLRSNLRCCHYELMPEVSCPWARRLISVAGYMPPPGGSPLPLIRLEYRLRVRGIMLPRRMKVQVPVPHSLQRVVHNPLYDMHEPPLQGVAGFAAPHLPGAAAGGGAAAGAVMAPPPAQPGGGVPPGVGAGEGGGGPGGAAGLLDDGGEGGLMDNLEDNLDVAMRTEPLLFANMVDAAVVRPTDDEEPGPAAAAAAAAGPGPGPGHPHPAGGGGGPGNRGVALLRSASSSVGSLLVRGFLSSRRSLLSGGSGPPHASGGSVQWLGPGSPGVARTAEGGVVGGCGGEEAATAGCRGAAGAGCGWSVASPPPPPLVRLQNKPPHWNDALMCWCLNFRGRVKMASVKNFQLMCTADSAGRCVMQFGKVEEGVYVLDFNPCVLTAAQAFAVALSTFETKYLL